MIEIADILVRGNRFADRYETQRIQIKSGDYCLVESQIGIQMGKVVSAPRMMKARCVDKSLLKIIRKASDRDMEILAQIEETEKEAMELCLTRIEEYGLKMKLIKIIFAFDRSKGLFMFTADARVDFRELVRDLAHHFKTRIEMRQIGIRDEARIRGGIGNCGCPLCCVTFLREFHPVSIKMAKDQGLSLIPSKISGLCGRLMCCLQYEHQHYSEQMKKLPKMGKRVMTPKGEGRVRQLNILKGLVMVSFPVGGMEEFSSSDVTPYHIYLEQKEIEDKEKEKASTLEQEQPAKKTRPSTPQTRRTEDRSTRSPRRRRQPEKSTVESTRKPLKPNPKPRQQQSPKLNQKHNSRANQKPDQRPNPRSNQRSHREAKEN